MGIRCFTCKQQFDVFLCFECFCDGDHSGHLFEISKVENSICSCGNPQNYKSESFCCRHKANPQAGVDDQRLQHELAATMMGLVFFSFFSTVDRPMFQLFTQSRFLLRGFITKIAEFCKKNSQFKLLFMKTLIDPDLISRVVPPKIYQILRTAFADQSKARRKAIATLSEAFFGEDDVSDLSKCLDREESVTSQ